MYSHIKKRDDEERVLLVGVQLVPETDEEAEASLLELNRLVETLDGKVMGSVIQKRKRPNPAVFIGRGKIPQILEAINSLECSLVAFDNELTGGQQKSLEKELNCRVVDRTGVILDIFSKHARSREAKIQVEMASLDYLSSRLTRRWTHLGRQKGGIGLKGLGEKQIELDRRQIRTRLSKLKVELTQVTKVRAVQRSLRDRFLRVAIVGYTNAGKSTLMNRLTASEVYVDDKLFATLDSTVRVLDPKTRPPILLSDTVGFIKKLPHGLVASFRSTLQEVLEANLLLHVVDLSSSFYPEEIRVTEEVLKEIGANDKPSLLVFNKADLVREPYLPKILERKYLDSIVLSANKPKDILRLRKLVDEYFERDMMEMEVMIPYQDTWLSAQIHAHSKILETEFLEMGTRLKIRIMRQDAQWLKLENKVL